MGPFLVISLILVLFSYSFHRKFKPLLKLLLFLAEKTTDMNVDEPGKKSLHFFLYRAGICNESASCCELDTPKMNPIECEATIAPKKCPCDGSERANSSGAQPSDIENLGIFKRITSKSCAHELPYSQGRSGHLKQPLATGNPEYSGESKASQQSDKSNHSSFRAFDSRTINKTRSENKDLYKDKAVLEINHIGSFHATGEASNQVSSSFGKRKSCEQQLSLQHQNGNHQRRRCFLLHPRGSSKGIKSDSGRRKSDSDRIFQPHRWRSPNSESEDCLNVSNDFFSPHAHRNQAHPIGHGKNKPSSISWESSPVALTPIFGDWDESDPRSAEGFTYMFEKLKREKEVASSKFPDLLPDPINYKSPPEKQKSQTSASKIFCCFVFRGKRDQQDN